MATEFHAFSFKNVNVIWGIIQIEGYAEGDDAVTIEYETDQFNDSAGAKGDVVRTQTNDNRCAVTIKLFQNSTSNKLLTAAYNVDANTGVGVQPMVIEDKESGEAFTINNAWIRKYPIITRGQGVNTMEWVFRGDKMVPLIT